MVFPYVYSVLVGYLLGSIPAGYFVVKNQAGVDLRREGSGNVGAMNAFEVSRSRSVGIVVMALDMMKGILAVMICALLVGREYDLLATSGAASVLGHNYPVWLGGRGGRGLATAAGVMLLLGWFVVILWAVAWTLCYLFTRHLHGANIVATAVLPFALLLMPASIFKSIAPTSFGNEHLLLLTTIISLLILLRHIEPMRELARGFKHS